MFPSIELKTAFLRFSQTTEGVLTTAELRDLLQSLSYDTRSPSLREMLEQVDKEGETVNSVVYFHQMAVVRCSMFVSSNFVLVLESFHEHSDQSVIYYSMAACLYE